MSQVDQSTIRQIVTSKFVTTPVCVCITSASEISVRVYYAAAKEAAQMFAFANVRRQRVTFTQCRSVGRLDVHLSMVGEGTGEDKRNRVYCLMLVIR